MALNIISGGDNRIELPAGGSFSAGNPLKISSNTVVVCTDGVQPCGWALNDGAATDTANAVVVLAPAVIRITAANGVNFAPGDAAYIASATTIDAGSQGNYSCGNIVNTNPATTGECELDIRTSYAGTDGPAHA
jgi:hypothetical protein